ncbi:SDR family NAD(P)-dependent oxidoreductase, partial [Streptomyces boncukensis]
VPLPGYPFAGERHWIGGHGSGTGTATEARDDDNSDGGGGGCAEDAPAGIEHLLFYRPVWQAAPHPGEPPAGPLLLLGGPPGHAEALRATTGRRVVQARPGDRFARHSRDTFTLDPSRRDHHTRLREALDGDADGDGDGAAPVAVLCLTGLDPAEQQSEDAGLRTMFPLCQAWMVGRTETLPVVYAYRARQEHPGHAAVGGFARSIRLEQPRLAVKTVRFTAQRPDDGAERAALLAEAADPDTVEVAYDRDERSGAVTRRTLGFARTGPVPDTGPALPPARPGGVYLITGGAGGLGLHLARHLARRAPVSLALLGRSPEGPAQRAAVAGLETLGSRARYLSADVTDPEQTRRAVAEVRRRFGPLSGVVHSAGVLADALCLNKAPEDVARVLGPKIAGTRSLDAATADAELDYFALFSSASAVMGSAGSTDYSAANRYLDSFAAHREEQRAAGERHGRTLALDWPVWRHGGMRIDPAVEELVLGRAGMVPLETDEGLAAFDAALAHDAPQLVVLRGDRALLERRLAVVSEVIADTTEADTGADSDADTGADTAPRTDYHAYLVERVAELLDLPPGADTTALDEHNFMELGLTSAALLSLVERLQADLGVSLPPTELFRYPGTRALADRLAAVEGPRPATHTQGRPAARPEEAEAVAIIGMAGLFPGARSPDQLWEHLAAGTDLVTPVPEARWDHSRYHDPSGRPGTTDCAFGGFLDDITAFDAPFFGVLAAEAEGMDPQLRLLLQTLYAAAEDAALAGRLRGSATGVYVGQCFQDYDDEMVARRRTLGAHDPVGVAVSMSANRPSFAFDLRGPSLTVDTACSSSLYALHLAVEALRRGECEMAFAAGTNLILSPRHYLRLSAIGALSPTGRCRVFDRGADGYVPGEAVAALLLKPLERALADGDPVHAVIRSTAVSHGGHASSLTAPDPRRQAELLERAWRRAGIAPDTLGLLEAHGTGTALGDPIEVEGARTAFARFTDRERFCALGSVKANLGHTEGAAGVTSVLKGVLAMRHGLIPAMPNHAEPNPYCELGAGPLFVNREPLPWPSAPGRPRRAAVSSFGFGGAYAHVVLEEAPQHAEPVRAAAPGPWALPFSARTPDRLRAVLEQHRALAATGDYPALDRAAATLRTGRQALRERAAVVARTPEGLRRGLDALLADGAERVAAEEGGAPDALRDLAARWTAGEDVRWPEEDAQGHADGHADGYAPVRAHLPTYPFAGERYWLDGPADARPPEEPAGTPAAHRDNAVAAAAYEVAARPGDYDGRAVADTLDRFDALVRRMLARTVRDWLGPQTEITAEALCARLAEPATYERFARAIAAATARPAPAAQGPAPDAAQDDPASGIRRLAAERPEIAAYAEVVTACLPRLPDVLTGRLDALEVYFPPDRPELLAGIYRDNAIADHHNALTARAVAAWVRHRRASDPGRPLRVLEVGAGTGGTTRRVLAALEGHGPALSYTFTDVSAAFLPAAERELTPAAPPGVDLAFQVFDLEAEPEDQGLDTGAYDVVVAANVVHATRSLPASVGRLRRLLADGGVLVLNEVTSNRDHLTGLIGMMPGWWGYDRPEERLPHSPLLDVAGWRRVLEAGGFDTVRPFGAADLPEEEYDHAVLLARGAPGSGTAPGKARRRAPARAAVPAEAAPESGPPVRTAVLSRVRTVFADFFRLPPEQLDPRATFDRYGLDSLGAIQLARTLEADFGRLPKVLLYEQPTMEALTGYLLEHAPESCANLTPASPAPDPDPDPGAGSGPGPGTGTGTDAARGDDDPDPVADPVAVVGMAGVFPGSPDLGAWWRHLADGDDLVTEIPPDRFDWRAVYGDPDRELGKVNSRWGAFLDGVDRFDAEFFGVSPLEAQLMDPQQRLMLQTAWHAVEDAGHAPSSLRGTRTGVFVGATSRDYNWHLLHTGRAREGYVVSGNGHCVLANRISFQLDLRGPSEAVDTACSSSLTALHRAVQSVRRGECEAALVGGVHTFLNEELFVALGQLGMLSPDGRCRAFDHRANGFVRGEGVAAVYLKPLSRARADGDTVYAVIRASGVGHGGRVRSLTVPNPAAQAELIASVYREAGVDPRTVSYIEAHGTGTQVGDPIELRGLRSAFAELTGAPEGEPGTAWCGIGTVKSNMGHLEAAAGLAGVLKTVLALRHGTLPATLHVERPNPLLEIEDSPFYVVDSARPWTAGQDAEGRPLPRRAGVTSIGFGGTNAHVVVEEPPPPPGPDAPEPGGTQAVVLSARTGERLRAQASALLSRLTATEAPDAPDAREALPSLPALAYTLQTGRDALPHRLAVLAEDHAALRAGLRSYLDGDPDPESVLTGVAAESDDPGGPDDPGDPGGPGDPAVWARRWVAGTDVPWSRLRPDGPPRRVSLPGYPFEPARHWAEPPAAPGEAGEAGEAPDGSAELHELLEALLRGEKSVDEVDRLLVLDSEDGT